MTTQTARRFSEISINACLKEAEGDLIPNFQMMFSKAAIASAKEYAELFQSDKEFTECTFSGIRFGDQEWQKTSFVRCKFIECTFFDGVPNHGTFIGCTYTWNADGSGYKFSADTSEMPAEEENLKVDIGCQTRSIGGWKNFFHPDCIEVIWTPRGSQKFEEIENTFREFLLQLGGRTLVGTGW